MKNRILMFLQNQSYPDDTRVLQEAIALAEAGYQVSVICPTGERRSWYEKIDGVSTYRYPKPPELGGLFGYVLEYSYSLVATLVISWYVLVRRGFDVIHAHSPPDLFVLLAWPYKLLGKRFVFDHHDLSPELYQAQCAGQGSRWVEHILRRFERWTCRTADRLIATNETQRSIQINRGGAAAHHCYVVRNGPDARFLQPIEASPALRQTGRTIVGYVGMISVQDGVDYLVRAAEVLKSNFQRDDFLVVIVGSGPAVSQLQQLCQELDLAEVIHFAGYLSGADLLAHIASFDIAVTPDPSNPYNDSCTTIKTMEYMAMAKPVVAFDLPENRQTAGNAALYARPNCVEEMAELIARLIDDPALRHELGQHGRQRVCSQYMWDDQKANLVALYDDLLGIKMVRDTNGKPHDGIVAAPASVDDAMRVKRKHATDPSVQVQS